MPARARHTIAVLVSGGVDSTLMLALACKRFDRVFPVYVQSGMRWEKAELFWLRRLLSQWPYTNCGSLHVLANTVKDLYPRHWSVAAGKKVPGARSQDEAVFLPGRNLLLLSKVSVFCYVNGIRHVGLGTLGTNPFPDGQRDFLMAFEKAYAKGMGRPLKIWTPFLNRKKSQIMRYGRSLPLESTFSCLAPRGMQPCKKCNKCAERHAVLGISEV